eukprot:1138653-Pyramimonas_sp.AAC.1
MGARSGGMATLAASNVAGLLQGFPVLAQGADVIPFVEVGARNTATVHTPVASVQPWGGPSEPTRPRSEQRQRRSIASDSRALAIGQ